MTRAYQSSFDAMGSRAHVMVLTDHPERAVDLIRIAHATVGQLERRWSRFLPDSDISRINAASGRPVMVDDTTIEVVGLAIDAWQQTDGVFDPTVGRCLVAAGYDRSFTDLAPLTVSSVRSAPAPTGVEVHPVAQTITVPEGTQLDVGGIGKGAAADRTVLTLLEAGAQAALVNLGGDLRAEGDGPADGWTIDLDCPGSDLTRTIRIASGAVCTSSTTKRRWQTIDGERHHIIDASSGSSSMSDLCSATVVGAEAAQCEVLATSAVAVGRQRASELIEQHHAAGLLVSHGGDLTDVGSIGAFR